MSETSIAKVVIFHSKSAVHWSPLLVQSSQTHWMMWGNNYNTTIFLQIFIFLAHTFFANFRLFPTLCFFSLFNSHLLLFPLSHFTFSPLSPHSFPPPLLAAESGSPSSPCNGKHCSLWLPETSLSGSSRMTYDIILAHYDVMANRFCWRRYQLWLMTSDASLEILFLRNSW